jgi:hypothetical protein
LFPFRHISEQGEQARPPVVDNPMSRNIGVQNAAIFSEHGAILVDGDSALGCGLKSL